MHVQGPQPIRLLAVWAQNASAGLWRKDEPGPLGRGLGIYSAFLTEGPAIVAGDFNNNTIWDRPGWPISHGVHLQQLRALGLISAYHAMTGEAPGEETRPTLYWRDRKEDGPVYHIDYVFLPEAWVPRIGEMRVGAFADWCGKGLSDHAPVWIDLAV